MKFVLFLAFVTPLLAEHGGNHVHGHGLIEGLIALLYSVSLIAGYVLV